MSILIRIFLLTLCLALAGPAGSIADDQVDRALAGFEDEAKPKQASPGAVDEALSGFGDSADEPTQESSTDEALSGFGDGKGDSGTTDGTSQASPPVAGLPDWLDLGGSLTLSSALSYAHGPPLPGFPDQRWLSRFRAELDLEANLKLSETWRAKLSGQAFYDPTFAIKGRSFYTDEFLETYEREAELVEAWVAGPLAPNLDLKLGRQIMVWGKADNVRVVDVLNPLDNRLPGLVDIEDLRLPVAATRLDLYLGNWSLTGVMIHENRFDKLPVFGSDFFPNPTPLPGANEPDFSLDNQEYGLALSGVFSGWDISFHGAYVFNDQPFQELTAQGPRGFYDRLWMGGAAFNVALGSWLLKAETAYLDGFRFSSAPGRKFARIDAMLGVEYTGFTDTTIALELVNRHLLDFDPIIEAQGEAKENSFQSVLRISRTFLHETLELTFLASTFGLDGSDGGFQRLQLTYDLTDSWELTVGLLNYFNGDLRNFRNVDANDRIFAQVKYHF